MAQSSGASSDDGWEPFRSSSWIARDPAEGADSHEIDYVFCHQDEGVLCDDPVWLFMDDNQQVYETQLDVPRAFQPFELTVNCRNTQAIHQEVMKLYEGGIAPGGKRPAGPTRRAATTATTRQPRWPASSRVYVARRRCRPPRTSSCCPPVAQTLLGEWRPTEERGKLGKHVYCSSIRAFKGLESPVVVLCELEDIDDVINQQLYVPISRRGITA